MVVSRAPQGVNVEYSKATQRVEYGREKPFPLSAAVWVVPQDVNAADDGRLDSPFQTIQAAIDTVRATGLSGTIFISPGVYNETLILGGGVRLVALGNQFDTFIYPSTNDMPAIVISDATKASVQNWLAAGSANYLANLGMLVGTGTQCSCAVYGLQIFGNGPAPGIAGAGLAFQAHLDLELSTSRNDSGDHCMWGNKVEVNFNEHGFASDSFIGNDITLFGSSEFRAVRSQFGSIEAHDDSEIDLHQCVMFGIDMLDDSEFGQDNSILSADVLFMGGIDLNDSCLFTLSSGFCRGNLDVEGGVVACVLQDVHIEGTSLFQNVAPNNPAFANGGRFVGAVTDVGVRLTRILGT